MHGRTIVVFMMLASFACGTSSTLSAPSSVPSATPPSISSVSPAIATAGSADITIAITGSGFQPGLSFAVWSASGVEADLLTRYVSDTQLTAILPAKLLRDPAPGQVSVVNGDSMGWSDGIRRYPTSNALSFSIVDSRVSTVAGKWVGTFDTSDPADCHTDTPASATFEQDGDRVYGVLGAVNACGLSGVVFDGGFEGGYLQGSLSTGGFSGSAVGTLAGDTLELRVSDLWDPSRRGQVPAGVMHLRRSD